MSESYLYTLQSTVVRGNGQREYATIETHHASLDKLAEDLRSGPVVVTQLFSKPTEKQKVREITDTREIMITSAWVYIGAECDQEFIEAGDKP